MKFPLIASAVLLVGSTAATAQEAASGVAPPAAQDGNDLRVRVGLGAQVQPDYLGADGMRVGPLFHVNIAHGDEEFRFGAPDDSAGIALVTQGGFSFGPAGNIAGSRKNSDVGALVGRVARTFEVGAFAQYEWHDSFRVRGQLLKGINGHEGLVGTISADKIWRDGDRYVFSIGPRVKFSDGRYQRAYLGVTPAAALATGLPEYRPSGGVHAVGVASGASYALNDEWGLFGYARYERLVGDAAASPIVRQLGSRNQLAAGIGLNYTFTVRR